MIKNTNQPTVIKLGYQSACYVNDFGVQDYQWFRQRGYGIRTYGVDNQCMFHAILAFLGRANFTDGMIRATELELQRFKQQLCGQAIFNDFHQDIAAGHGSDMLLLTIMRWLGYNVIYLNAQRQAALYHDHGFERTAIFDILPAHVEVYQFHDDNQVRKGSLRAQITQLRLRPMRNVVALPGIPRAPPNPNNVERVLFQERGPRGNVFIPKPPPISALRPNPINNRMRINTRWVEGLEQRWVPEIIRRPVEGKWERDMVNGRVRWSKYEAREPRIADERNHFHAQIRDHNIRRRLPPQAPLMPEVLGGADLVRYLSTHHHPIANVRFRHHNLRARLALQKKNMEIAIDMALVKTLEKSPDIPNVIDSRITSSGPFMKTVTQTMDTRLAKLITPLSVKRDKFDDNMIATYTEGYLEKFDQTIVSITDEDGTTKSREARKVERDLPQWSGPSMDFNREIKATYNSNEQRPIKKMVLGNMKWLGPDAYVDYEIYFILKEKFCLQGRLLTDLREMNKYYDTVLREYDISHVDVRLLHLIKLATVQAAFTPSKSEKRILKYARNKERVYNLHRFNDFSHGDLGYGGVFGKVITWYRKKKSTNPILCKLDLPKSNV